MIQAPVYRILRSVSPLFLILMNPCVLWAVPGIHEKVQNHLDLQLQIQDRLQSLNQSFDQLFQTPTDAKRHVQYRLILPKTLDESHQKNQIQFELGHIQKIESHIHQVRLDLRESLQEDPTFGSDLGWNGRVLGLQTLEPVALIDGWSIAPAKNLDRTKLAVFSKGVREACFYDPDLETHSDSLDFFLNVHTAGMSCIYPTTQKVELLEDPVLSMNAKIQMLTGSILPAHVIEKGKVDFPLDFSNAPKLDVIVLSYLEFKHDFSGRVMAQALTYHARRGTQIRILLPGLPIPGTNFVRKKDQKLLDTLTRLGSHVQVKKYAYSASNPDLLTPFQYIGRSQHSKLMAVVSYQDPSKSGLIVGGRNIKDTFYIKFTPNYTQWPEMVQYSKDEELFGFFRDLEVSIPDHRIAEHAVAQVMSFWNRDKAGPKVVRSSEHMPVLSLREQERAQIKDRLKKNTFVRHFFSAPFVDDRAMEEMFVQMFDSARTRIRMVSPYLRPPERILNALVRAAKRGVQFDLITGFTFENDNVAPFTGDLNRMSVNQFLKAYEKYIKAHPELRTLDLKIRIHEWREPNPASVMHSKVVSIDDDLIYIGSANFNRRSFAHDTENGALMTGPTVVEFNSLFDGFYLSQTKKVESKQKVQFFWQLLIRFLDATGMT